MKRCWTSPPGKARVRRWPFLSELLPGGATNTALPTPFPRLRDTSHIPARVRAPNVGFRTFFCFSSQFGYSTDVEFRDGGPYYKQTVYYDCARTKRPTACQLPRINAEGFKRPRRSNIVMTKRMESQAANPPAKHNEREGRGKFRYKCGDMIFDQQGYLHEEMPPPFSILPLP